MNPLNYKVKEAISNGKNPIGLMFPEDMEWEFRIMKYLFGIKAIPEDWLGNHLCDIQYNFVYDFVDITLFDNPDDVDPHKWIDTFEKYLKRSKLNWEICSSTFRWKDSYPNSWCQVLDISEVPM